MVARKKQRRRVGNGADAAGAAPADDDACAHFQGVTKLFGHQLTQKRTQLEHWVAHKAAEAASLTAGVLLQRTREEVLADLCQLLEAQMLLRQRAAGSTSSSSPPDGADATTAAADATAAAAAAAAAAGGAACSDAAGGGGSGSSSSFLDDVLGLVPRYGCMAELLSGACPGLARSAARLSTADWSRMATELFRELVVLLEYCGRPHQQQTMQPTAAAAPAAVPGGSTSGAAAAAAVAGGDAGAPPAAPAAAAAAAPAAPPPSSTPAARLEFLVDSFFGLAALAMVTGPLPLLRAVTINHAEQRRAPPPPELHADVLQRLRLTVAQAAYLDAALQEVLRLRSATLCNFGALLRDATTPGVLVLAAQQEAAQAAAAAAAAGGGTGRHGSSATGAAAAAAAPSTLPPPQQPHPAAAPRGAGSGAGGAPAPASPAAALPPSPAAPSAEGAAVAAPACSLEQKLSDRVDLLPMYAGVMLMLLVDALTVEQKATMLVACFPWLPTPMQISGRVSSALKQQQAALECQHLQQLAAEHATWEADPWYATMAAAAAAAMPAVGDGAGLGVAAAAAAADGGSDGDVTAAASLAQQQQQQGQQGGVAAAAAAAASLALLQQPHALLLHASDAPVVAAVAHALHAAQYARCSWELAVRRQRLQARRTCWWQALGMMSEMAAAGQQQQAAAPAAGAELDATAAAAAAAATADPTACCGSGQGGGGGSD